jgi:hypothetical protein
MKTGCHFTFINHDAPIKVTDSDGLSRTYFVKPKMKDLDVIIWSFQVAFNRYRCKDKIYNRTEMIYVVKNMNPVELDQRMCWIDANN